MYKHLPHPSHCCFSWVLSQLGLVTTLWSMYQDPVFAAKEAEIEKSKFFKEAQPLRDTTEVKPAFLRSYHSETLWFFSWDLIEIEKGGHSTYWLSWKEATRKSHDLYCDQHSCRSHRTHFMVEENCAPCERGTPGRESENRHRTSSALLPSGQEAERDLGNSGSSRSLWQSSISGDLKYATNEWPPLCINIFQAL